MIKFFIIVLTFFSGCTTLFAQFNPNSFYKYIDNSNSLKSNDVVQYFPEYHSYINWTKAELVTEYAIPVTYSDPNIGRNVTTLAERLKKHLSTFIFSALKKVQVTSIFVIEDILKRNQRINTHLLSTMYSLTPQNPVIKDSYIKAQMTLPLYGQNSLSEPFFTRIKSTQVTNYLQKETVSSFYYDTLIIDMIMFEKFKPSLMIKIIDQKSNILHSVETLNQEALTKRGPVYFVSSLTEAFNHPARGKSVAYVMPENISGIYSSDIVLFNTDAKRIFSQQRTLNALQDGKVIIIMPVDKNL
ncbi:MAG: hypothetical protein ACRCV0_03830 [Brevinema sp.]